MAEPVIPLEWLPTLPRRYLTTFIDALLVVFMIVVPTMLWPAEGAIARLLRGAIAFTFVFAYEPVCTGRFVSLGQWAMGVRVRMFDDGQKIGIARAYVRIVVKGLLGVISFFTLAFTTGRRAIHDMATGSIVVTAKAERDFSRWASDPTREPMRRE